jgi:ABC-2 type transport system ATP-binding protein
MPPLLEVDAVRKSYGPLLAVDGVSFAVEGGTTLGLLGPNGAGKTTTVSMIAGLLAPDAGQVRLKGRTIASETDPLKLSLGLVPQELALWEQLSARENLGIFGALQGLAGQRLHDAVATWLGFVGLEERADDRVETFSGGMKRRLNLAAGLLHDPDVVLLDEPTVGVDPQSRNALFEALAALEARGKALLYTTHYMEEAERLCDRVVIVDHGRVVAEDTVRGLYGRLEAQSRLRIEIDDAADGPWLTELRELPEVAAATVQEGVLVVSLRHLDAGTPAVLALLQRRGRSWTHIASERADLEAVFLALTGRTLRD